MSTISSRLQETGKHLQTTRLQLRSIFVGIDFSRSAHAGLRVAMALARQFGSKLILGHALPPLLAPVEAPLDPSMLEASADSARQKLHSIGKELESEGIRHEEVLAESAAPAFLCEMAKQHDADLIVVGSHGAKGIEKLALGSVAEGILRRSHIPVMIVGPKCETGKVSANYRSVLLATDLGIGSLRAAQYAAAIAEETNSKLTLLHVGSEARDISAAARGEVQERLKHLVPDDADQWCRPNLRVEVGDPAAQILNSALAEEADLIVLGTRGAGPLSDHAPWSTVSKVIRGAACPVLAVPAHSA